MFRGVLCVCFCGVFGCTFLGCCCRVVSRLSVVVRPGEVGSIVHFSVVGYVWGSLAALKAIGVVVVQLRVSFFYLFGRVMVQ